MILKGIICERLKTDETFFTDSHPYFTTRSKVILPEVSIPLTTNFNFDSSSIIGFIQPNDICDDGDCIKFKAIVTDESAKSWLRSLNDIRVGGYYTNVVTSDKDPLIVESAKLMAISICKNGFYKAEVDDKEIKYGIK